MTKRKNACICPSKWDEASVRYGYWLIPELCAMFNNTICPCKRGKKKVKASQGAFRLTHSLDVHTTKQCDKVYVPSMCECALWKHSCFMPEQPAVKRKRSTACEADPQPAVPWCPSIALYQKNGCGCYWRTISFSFLLSENEISTVDRYKSPLIAVIYF